VSGPMEPGTPLPWGEWHGDIIAAGDAASDYDDYVIAGIGVSRGSRSSFYSPVKAHKPAGKANAAYIVRACNSFPDLVEAANKAREHLAAIHPAARTGVEQEVLNALADAITKAQAPKDGRGGVL